LVHVGFAIILKDEISSELKKGDHPQMKKILAIAIGFGLVLGTVSFAQDKMTDTTKTEKKSKKKSKKETSTDKMSTEKKM
jgi:hypothetical protein